MDRLLEQVETKRIIEYTIPHISYYANYSTVIYGIDNIHGEACFLEFFDKLIDNPSGNLFYLIKLNNLNIKYDVIISDLNKLLPMFDIEYRLIEKILLLVKFSDKKEIPVEFKYSVQLLSLCCLRALDNENTNMRKHTAENLKDLLNNFVLLENRTSHGIHDSFYGFGKDVSLLNVMVDKFLDTLSKVDLILNNGELLEKFVLKFNDKAYMMQTNCYNLLEEMLYGQN